MAATKCFLLCPNGRYLTADVNGTDIYAKTDTPLMWEEWEIVPVAEGAALRSVFGGYLSVDIDGSVAVQAKPSTWETFKIGRQEDMEKSGEFVSLETCHETFLTASADGTVSAAAGSCKFQITPVIKETVGIFNYYHQRYLTANADGSASFDGLTRGPSQVWTVERDGDKVSFKSKDGLYLCAEANGALVANRKAANIWEKFSVLLAHGGFGLKSHHGKWVCAEKTGRAVADRGAALEWETLVFQ
eukprot:CAMPEP_0117006102 /NCGR_PEP_ID=MMETSP0472-20121206/6456_1 /TAXON_ID=693140 ORGANISM="Tiarina fusus, Strain LIS" /NCGR_SAMPLE_ID=MMETSP0472 /ASSEMBLY_ACC=CAM_ASM_000603 /LENGTH=244 /DNA_ID=CAMNT_0004707483 /DNA_START=16 /DNA_END=750 /DNA_ORIENTATION=+